MRTDLNPKRLVLAALAIFTPGLAVAHPGHAEVGAWAGLAHPFTGADHVLAMVAVGLWAALRGGRAIWAWPLAFVAALLAGYGVGRLGIGIPLVEPTILASIIVLGALIAADARAPMLAGVSLIALFGLAHGVAHGAEASASGGLAFPIGMAVSTLALHALGAVAALALRRLQRPGLVRLLGLGAATGGVLLAVSG